MESTAPRGQFLAERNWFLIRLPMYMVFAPPIISEIKKKPRDGINVWMEPAKIPGMVSGRMTRVKVCARDAPRSLAASRRDLSSFSMEVWRGSTVKGSSA